MHRILCAACAAGLLLVADDSSSQAALANPTPGAAPPASPQQPPATTTIVVTANPLRHADPAAPISVLSGAELAARRGATLGETLDGMPGVAASAFGPNASRPIIRGQDGERIRVLANGGAALDASALSEDHAVPLEPLLIERVEVVRGPAALLYGGSAIGGVVNTIDGRLPRQLPPVVQGRGELRGGGAAGERVQAVVLDAPFTRVPGRSGGLALHIDAFSRRTEDPRVPAFTVENDDGVAEQRTRVRNAASDSGGAGLGVGWIGSTAQAAVSLDNYRSTYGVVVEPEVTIRLQRERLAMAGEWRAGGGALEALRWQASYTRYRHEEVGGGGEVGTVFRNRGGDLRLEAVQRTLALGAARWQGLWGVQIDRSRFAALGEEAFVPGARTQSQALFGLQSLLWPERGELTLGLRAERVRVASAGDAAGVEEERFGAAMSRRFAPRSVALGGGFMLAPGWRATLQLAHSQRAPASHELYANGVHVATGTFERGNPGLQRESGRSADLRLAWLGQGTDPHRVMLGVFHQRFSNYLTRLADGEFEGEEGGRLPLLVTTGVAARLAGAELEVDLRLAPGLRLAGGVDTLRGEDLTHGTALPRLAPRRWRAALVMTQGPWSLRAEMRHAAAQRLVAPGDERTPGWMQLNFDLAWSLAGARPAAADGRDLELFLRGRNLGNERAYNASSVKSVRWLAPLPGRSVVLGLRGAF